jgi:hypothetical protein
MEEARHTQVVAAALEGELHKQAGVPHMEQVAAQAVVVLHRVLVEGQHRVQHLQSRKWQRSALALYA